MRIDPSDLVRVPFACTHFCVNGRAGVAVSESRSVAPVP
jgi:hypothetical protein